MTIRKQPRRITRQKLLSDLCDKHLCPLLAPLEHARAVGQADGLDRVEHLQLQEAALQLELLVARPRADGHLDDVVAHVLEAGREQVRLERLGAVELLAKGRAGRLEGFLPLRDEGVGGEGAFFGLEPLGWEGL